MKYQKDFGRKFLKNNTYMKEAMCKSIVFFYAKK